LLLRGIVRRKLLQLREIGLQQTERGLVGSQIFFFLGEQIAALAGFSVLQCGQQALKFLNDNPGMRFPVAGSGHSAQALGGLPADRGQDGHRNHQSGIGEAVAGRPLAAAARLVGRVGFRGWHGDNLARNLGEFKPNSAGADGAAWRGSCP